MNKKIIQLISFSLLVLLASTVNLSAQESSSMTVWRMTHPVNASDFNLQGPVKSMQITYSEVAMQYHDYRFLSSLRNRDVSKQLDFDKAGKTTQYPSVEAHFKRGTHPQPTFTYKEGRLIKVDRQIEEGELFILINFDYSVTDQLNYTTEHIENSASTKEYLVDNRTAKYVSEGGGAMGVTRTTIEFSYNDHNDVINIRGAFKSVESHELSDLNMPYNPNNPMVRLTKSTYTVEYIYDAQGNWTQQNVFASGKLVLSTKRKIEYYAD